MKLKAAAAAAAGDPGWLPDNTQAYLHWLASARLGAIILHFINLLMPNPLCFLFFFYSLSTRFLYPAVAACLPLSLLGCERQANRTRSAISLPTLPHCSAGDYSQAATQLDANSCPLQFMNVRSCRRGLGEDECRLPKMCHSVVSGNLITFISWGFFKG